MSDDVSVNLEEYEQLQRHALSTVPSVNVRMSGNLPNTPLAAATIAFLLGSVFCFGLLTFLGGFSLWWWTTYQLGFFIAAWSAFHFGEFAVTAGWNLEKCSVECECHRQWHVKGALNIRLAFLLDNGSMYHIANGSAVLEYIVTLYFIPSFKTRAWVSILGMFPVCSVSVLLQLTTEQCTGMIMVLLGQFMRSAAMIHASTNFSHSLAFRKLESHRLVTDGIYAYVASSAWPSSNIDLFIAGAAIHLMQVFSTGHWVPSWSYRTLSALFYILSCCGDSSIQEHEVSLDVVPNFCISDPACSRRKDARQVFW